MAFFTRRLARTNDDSGMTLVEVLAAMLIFAIVSTGLVYAMLQTLTLTRDARARQTALNLASQEIDLARDASDLFALYDDNYQRTINGDAFTVKRDTDWVANPDVSLMCGASTEGGVLRYKRVNVEVTWDNMRAGTDPVRSDTVIDPGTRLNDPSLGTIIVSVVDGAGDGRSGVGVDARPASPANGAQPLTVAPANTDAQGCSYVLKVVPGNYNLTVSRSGYVNLEHQTPSAQIVGVAAGQSVTAAFQYDLAGNYRVTLAGDYRGAGRTSLRIPQNFPVSYVSSYGTTQRSVAGTGLTRSDNLFPLSSGYEIMAGGYVASSELIAGCLSPSPSMWTLDDDATPLSTTAATGPGGRVDVDVPMGIVRLEGIGNTTYVRAETTTPRAGDPGCGSGMNYVFGRDLGSSEAYLALPYGTWRIFTGSASVQNTPVASSRLEVLTDGDVASDGSIVLEPQVAP